MVISYIFELHWDKSPFNLNITHALGQDIEAKFNKF